MRFLNQSQLLSEETMDKYGICLVGTGAIGSFTLMLLTKMGFKHTVAWDFDKVEEHNIPNQLFPLDSVGKKKSLATKNMCKQFSGEDVTVLATKATSKKITEYMNKIFSGKRWIVIFAVDSLDVRKEIAQGLSGMNATLIDARMGAKIYRVLPFQCATWDFLESYRRTLVSDESAVQERCGQKSIIYTVAGVAAEVCNTLHKVIHWHERDTDSFPSPVVFDYATGMRLQKILTEAPIPLEDINDPVLTPADTETPTPGEVMAELEAVGPVQEAP